MNRELAYQKLGHARQFMRNKAVADVILDALERFNKPLTTNEIYSIINDAPTILVGWYEMERILNDLSKWNNKVVIKTLVADEKPTFIHSEVTRLNVRIDGNGNYVFRDKIVAPNGTILYGNFGVYFWSLPENERYYVHVPMLINIKRNYWSLAKDEEVA